MGRAEFSDIVARSERRPATDWSAPGWRARTPSRRPARPAVDAEDRERAAAAAKQTSDTALAAADSAARDHVRQLAELGDQRAAVQAKLDAAEAQDAGLRAQRDRFRPGSGSWPRSRRPAGTGGATRRPRGSSRLADGTRASPPVLGGRGSVRQVIDRALSQVGVQYVWGGGERPGPSTGIPDGFGSPLNRVGFDCSGLMLYAYSAAGVPLPRVSHNQFNDRAQGAGVRPAARRPRVLQAAGGADPPRGDVHRRRRHGRGPLHRRRTCESSPCAAPGLVPQATRLL